MYDAINTACFRLYDLLVVVLCGACEALPPESCSAVEGFSWLCGRFGPSGRQRLVRVGDENQRTGFS